MTDHLFSPGEHMLDSKGFPIAGYTLSGEQTVTVAGGAEGAFPALTTTPGALATLS